MQLPLGYGFVKGARPKTRTTGTRCKLTAELVHEWLVLTGKAEEHAGQ